MHGKVNSRVALGDSSRANATVRWFSHRVNRVATTPPSLGLQSLKLSPREPIDTTGLERTAKGPLVLLFYDGFERRARRGLLGGLYSQGRRFARYAYRTLRRRQAHTGFYTAFLSLQRSLEMVGCDVRVNDFAAAEARPGYPIGVAGFPTVLQAVDLPNPTIFGPGDFGYPDESVAVAKDERFKILIQPGEWFCDYYRPYCGDKLAPWPVGIDVEAWPDLSGGEKSLDFVVYDKIRWYRDERVPAILDALVAKLRADGRSVEVLRYGDHALGHYRSALSRARALLFLCEHETQGIAYQEALASGVPVLAWDEGVLTDPKQIPFAAPDLKVQSVPYFDERCGMTFKLDEFDKVYPEFWRRLASFRPRDYVLDRLSMEGAARAYLDLYRSIAPGR